MRPALWVDMWNEQQLVGFNFLNSRGDSLLWVIARTMPEMSQQQAQQDLNSITARLSAEYPKTDANTHLLLTRPGLLGNLFGEPLRAFLAGLMLLAALVLAAACANLGGLYAARALDRTREFAIRLALGNNRAQIARSVLFESLVIAMVAGTLGCFLADLALMGLSSYRPPFGFPMEIAVNPRPVVYGLLCSSR